MQPSSSSEVKQSDGLTRRLLGDIGAAAISAALAAPFVAAIDTAITKNASGAMSLFPSLREELLVLQRKPLTYLTAPPFRWLWAVFFSTYAAANTANTLSRANGMSHTMPVLVSSTAANMSSAMAKDSAFAKMYGVTAPRPVPLGSYGCFFMRDIVSMAFFFTLPPLLSAELQARGAGKTTSDVSSQFLLPVAVQVVSNPWHLLGLNLYNEPKATAAERVQTVKRQLPLTIVARMLRIVPAFSLGGSLNKTLREAVHGPALEGNGKDVA